MLLSFGIQLGIIILFLILGWAVYKKKAYWLISGFNGRKKDEQEQLIDNGYPQRTGKLMLTTAAGMALLLPLSFTSFKYTIEIQFGFMLALLLGGYIYLSKYEIPKKRKRSYILSTALFIGTFSLVGVLMYFGYQDYQLAAGKKSFEITGVYGDKWRYQDVKKVELLDEMPEVTYRQNGFGMAAMAKGHFKVKSYGSCLLFIRKDSSPYLYIETDKQKIFINAKTPEQTKDWFNELKTKSGS